LLLAAEYEPENGAEVFQFFTRTPEMTKRDVTMFKRGSAGLDPEPVALEAAELEYLGQSVNLPSQLYIWSMNVCADDLMAFFELPVPAGLYYRVVDGSLYFSPGQLFLNRQELERLAFHVEYKVTVTLVRAVSHFEVKSRGRCITFAPQLIGNDTMQWQVVMPSAK
jgi:hypothetical protein